MSEAVTRSRAAWAVPLAIYVAAVAVYGLLGSLHEIPLIFPDEMTYGHLARSLAAGDGLSWYGSDESWPSALYVFLLAPSWVVASGESAYDLAKITGALVMCTVTFPVWALASRVVAPPRAALTVLLTLAGAWMLTSAGMLTENLAFPLSTAALASAVLALRGWDAGTRWAWTALAFAALATLARTQMGILFVVLLAALLLDAATAPAPRERLAERRDAIMIVGGIVVAGLVVYFAGSTSALGVYAEVSGRNPALADVAGAVGEQWVALAAASGFVPLAALLALTVQRRAWTAPDLGPLLCVTVAGVVVLLLQSGWFNAGVPGLDWGIERYVMYAIPLMLVTTVTAVDRGLPGWRAFAAAGGLVALSLLAAPDVRQAVEQRSTYATTKLLDGALGLSTGPALTAAALLVAATATLILARLRDARATYSIALLLLCVLTIQAQWLWRWQVDFTSQIRAQYPADLSWVDARAGGPVTRLYTYQNSALFQRVELFNDELVQSLVPAQSGPERPPLGKSCIWGPDERGAVQVSPGCGRIQHRIWNDDAYVQMSFHGGRVLARDPMLGQVFAVPDQPRVRSIIRMPCQRAVLGLGRDNAPTGVPKDLPCPPDMTVFLWVDAPGTLELTFKGGVDAQSVGYGGRTWRIPARGRTVVRIPVDESPASLVLRTGWRRVVGTQLVEAAFISGDRRSALL